MFGEKYSIKKYWIWSIIILIIQMPLNIFFNNSPMGNIEDANIIQILIVILLFYSPNIIWINVLANRIRDYGSNPWIALFALIPLVNIILGIYYGVKKSNNKIEEIK